MIGNFLQITVKNLNFEKCVLALLPVIIFAGILLLRPHWGLMDDHDNVYSLIPNAEKTGLFRSAWEYGVNDLTWGMFRPTCLLLYWLVYKPGIVFGSTITFLWNAVLSMLAIWYTAKVFSRILGIQIEQVLLVNGAFFYQYDLFQHPSLQEKLVISVGSAFVAACWDSKSWAKIAFWFFFGACTKASFMIYFSMGFWAFLAARESELFPIRHARAWIETALLGLAGALLLAAYIYISAHGIYTSHYFGVSIWPGLLSPFGAMFLAPVVAFVVGAFATGKWRTLRIYLPSIGVLAYLAIFLRWGIGGYVQSVIGTVFSCLLVQNANLYLARLPRRIWLVPVSLLALVVCGYRTYGSFVRLHDLGSAILAASAIAKEPAELWMPCEEGALAVKHYLEHEGAPNLMVHRALGSFDPAGKVFLYDSALCPFVGKGDAPPGCSAEHLWDGLWHRSFRIARMSCGARP